MKCVVCKKNIPKSVVKILATIKGNVAYITCEEHKGNTNLGSVPE